MHCVTAFVFGLVQYVAKPGILVSSEASLVELVNIKERSFIFYDLPKADETIWVDAD